jgi:hypothetical protein
MRSIRSTPTGGWPLPGFGENGSINAHSADQAQPAPSRQERLPAASSWRSAHTPPSPVSAAPFPQPMRTHPPRQTLYHDHCSRLLQSFPRLAAAIGRHQVTDGVPGVADGRALPHGVGRQLRIDRRNLAPSNTPVVAQLVSLAREHSRRIATAAEAPRY